MKLTPGKPFQPNLMFMGKTRPYSRGDNLKGASLGLALTRKH
jgi:hypothetical protein